MNDGQRVIPFALILIGMLFLGLALLGGVAVLGILSAAKIVGEGANEDPQTTTAPLLVDRAARQPDGSWRFSVSAEMSDVMPLKLFECTSAEVLELKPAVCQVRPPRGPPYDNPVAFSIHTPPIPEDRRQIQIRYVVRIQRERTDGSEAPTRTIENTRFIDLDDPTGSPDE